MAFSTGSRSGPLSEINVTPLVDVMLVLLIIFMITAPLLQHNISIDLPQPNPNVQPPQNPPTPINLSIKEDGSMYWNDLPVSDLELQAQLAVIGAKAQDQQPEVHISATDVTPYDYIARVLAEAKRNNVQKIGFEK
ncbi:MAG TPA: biopolymer transporter ExbD [Rhodanobacteraceae bacterium]|nr:biopolymer transporter ExbD [Rhodanobacteraceae bacterium]